MKRTRERLQQFFPVAFLLLLISIPPVTAESGWRQYADPREAGFDPAGLEEAQEYARSIQSAAVMVVFKGRVVAAWGEISRPYKCHSIRKSFLSALYGPFVENGAIRLDSRLSELGIDDLQSLTEQEKMATVRDLLSARSGVYHPAAYEPPGMADRRPARGAHPAGQHWFYNNWDFNTLGTIFEKRTGKGIFTAFQEQIATPIGMEDFRLADTFYWYEPSRSRHQAYLFRLSARDLARFGQLILQSGNWNGKQIVPQSWVKESTRKHVSFEGEDNGYGYMWWIYPGPKREGSPKLPDAVVARGAGGHVLLLAPSEELLIVHRTDTDQSQGAQFGEALRLARLILAAKSGEVASSPKLQRLLPLALTDSPAPGLHRQAYAPSEALLSELRGTYRAADSPMTLVIHHLDQRLFIRPEGAPLPETEMFAETATRFFNPFAPVWFEVVRDAQGNISHLLVSHRGRQFKATRVE